MTSYDDIYGDVYGATGGVPPPLPPPPLELQSFREPVGTPHFSHPFRLGAGARFATVEQDTEEEVTQCVEVLVSTRRGSRIEVPDYGLDDLVFTVYSQSDAVAAAIAEWEPRAMAMVTDTPDRLDELVRRVVIEEG